jgi:SNF2 family DNA or RNA helicase
MTVVDQVFEPLITDEPYKPRAWQEADLRFLGPMPYSANWSQMGCFKTSTALWLLQKKRVRNALIITSKVGKGAYFSDFYRCVPESWQLYNLGIHTCVERKGEYERPADLDMLLELVKRDHTNSPVVFLAHYDIFTNSANNSSRKRNDGGPGILDKLEKIEWDMIICDEAHRLKNRKAQWTINIKRLRAKNKHVMTGTGFVNNPSEIWSLLNFLDPKQWRGFWPFVNEWCEQFVTPAGYRIIKGVLPGKINDFRKLRQSLGPRHTMAEVHRSITKPVTTEYEVELGTDQKRMYNDIKTTLQTLDQRGATLQSPNVLSMLNRLRQISVATPQVEGRKYQSVVNRTVFDVKLVEPSAKLDLVMDLMEQLDDPEQKVVVFSNFTDPLDLLKVRLDKKKIGYVHLTQNMNENARYTLWHDRFREPQNQVFLSTLALGGESINLTCAQYLIFLDRSWSPAQMLQAVGRVYRPGQKNAVEVIHINSKGTVDSYVLSKLTQKENWFHDIFGD